MDIKLKNSENRMGRRANTAGIWAQALGWILLVVCTVLAGIGFSVQAAMWEIKQWSSGGFGYYDTGGSWIPYTNQWTCFISNMAEFNDTATSWGFGTIALALAAVVLLILLMVFSGRGDLDEEGNIRLNWYDRIWSEVHMTAAVGFGAGFVLLLMPVYALWGYEDWFGLYMPKNFSEEAFGISNRLVMVLCIVGLIGAAVFCLTSLVSLVKKLKAGMFWEKSLIGGILLFIWRTVRDSDRTTLKVTAFMILLCAIAGFFGMQAAWGYNDFFFVMAGAGICILLILAVVPGKIRKFKAIRSTAAEIRGGNLDCKAPVHPGKSGRLDELDRLAADLNHIGEAQQEAIASELKNQHMKTELISNVSHDLKTPLTSMAAYIDLLKKEGLDSANAPGYLEIIDQKTQRLKVLTENLFEAAKASSGAVPVSLEEINLGALVTQSLAEMEEKLALRRLSVIVRSSCGEDGEGCRVIADGQLLWRVVENILGNVSKYALEGSRVYVNLSRLPGTSAEDPSKVLLEVKNISADPLNISAEELMERFARGDESRNTEGSGLGLSIARDLTALMGGEFEIRIDGDLFKACVALRDAECGLEKEPEEAFFEAAESRSLCGETAGTAAGAAGYTAAAAEAVTSAAQSVGKAINSLKEKSLHRKS